MTTTDATDPARGSLAAMRWIPLVVPLLAALMTLNTYLIFWGLYTPH
jgi:hypothetical protein